MWPHSFIPIRRVIPWRIGALYRSGKFIHRRVRENFPGRMSRASRPQWLSLPVNRFCCAIDIFRIADPTGIAKRRASLHCRERQDKRQREAGKHTGRQQRAESRRSKGSPCDAAEAESAEQKNEGQGKHRRFRQVAEAQQCAKSRKHEPVAPPAPDAKQQRGGEKHKRRNTQVRRYPLGAQPKVTRPEKKDISPDPQGSRRNRQRFLGRFAGSLPLRYEFLQKQLKRGEARDIYRKIQEMRSRKFPLHRRMEVPKYETQEKRIQRTPISVDNLVQARACCSPGDFNIRNTVGSHVIAVRQNMQQPQNQDHAPEEDSNAGLGRRACRRKWILLFRLRASQIMHSSSAAKISPKLARRLCQDSRSED